MQPLCMLSCWIENPDGDHFKKHLSRISDLIWVAEDGLQLQDQNKYTSGVLYKMNIIVTN